ncbi:MAG: nickel pincer cofactor biosynthesis protein LarB [Melioribacteraceae bacterium]
MTEKQLSELLKKLTDKKITIEDAVVKLKSVPFKDESSEFINIDHHRQLRQGLPEVIYGESKTTKQILSIAEKLSTQTYPVLFTRLKKKQIKKLKEQFPKIEINEDARTATLNQPKPKTPKKNDNYVLIVSAGTSDFRVVEEAKEVCISMEIPFRTLNDVGVSGIHRLLKHTETLQEATAVVVIAGMEGALASVVGGLVSSPIFAVPTSVGYGANFNGVSALLSMLNSCAPGVTVSNIDNGFSAAVAACRVVQTVMKKK